MDSTNDSYMSFHSSNNNVDINQFLNGVQDFANFQDDTQGLDPALFDIGTGDSGEFHPQQGQSAQANHANYNQAQRQTQSQSPALPSFKSAQNTFSTHPYGQSLYDQRSMAHPAFDSHLAARPSASPQPFDPFNVNYNQQFADPRYNNFTTQRQSTPTQPFRPQVNPTHYMNLSNPSSRPQPHISQIQNAQGLSYPYPQASQLYRTVDPSMLNAGGQVYQRVSNEAQPGQTTSSPYFQQMSSTLNPRDIQPQYNMQMQRPQGLQVNAHQTNGMLSQQAQQSILQFQPQSTAALVAKATKEPKAKARKGSGKGGSASDSDDDLDIEDEPPEAKPAMLSILKPTEQPGKLLWEVVDAVWSPRNKPASADKIRTAVASVGEAVRNVRDQWKAQNEQLKKAELPAAPTALQVPALKAAVGTHRETMERLVVKVAQFGHPWILKRLGENHFTLAALYSFLLDRVNADDYNSTLATGILQLGSKFETLDEEVLEKVKWTKILARFVKKSTNDSKKLAQQIIDNAKANTAKKLEGTGQGPASPAGSASGKSVPPVAGVKRAREGSEPTQQVKKPAVKPSSKPLSLQIAEARKAKEKEKAAAFAAAKGAKTEKAAAPINGTSTVTARPKVTAAAPPKVSQFASLMSASKRPGTSNAERAAKDKVEAIKKTETPSVVAVKKDTPLKTDTPFSRPISAAPPASSFLGFLADMDKPKEAPAPKPEENLNETPEARARRLRKESRRKLRVSWKNDNELVQTRIFEHDPDEETGHEDSMMRDAGDTMKEGEMLRQQINLDEMDEDEDEMEYSPPSEVDFEAAGKELFELNFFKFGGARKPESPVSEAQDKHEEGNLMTTYTSHDQPDTPKEPPEDAEDDDFSPAVDFGESSKDFVRQREKQVLARRQPYQPQQPQPPDTNGFDLASVLANMQSQQAVQNQSQNWQQPLYNQQSQPQAQPQQANLQSLDISKLLAVAQQMQQGQQPSQPSYQAPTVPPLSSSTPAIDPSIAALLASFNHQDTTQASGTSAHVAALPIGQGANPNPWPGVNAEPPREQAPKQKNKKSHQGKGKVPLGPDGLPLNYKTQVCQFWLDGRCMKGDACTYAHEKR